MSSENNTWNSIVESIETASTAIDEHYELKDQKSSVGKEFLSGLMNFLTAFSLFAFIPSVMSLAGADSRDVFIASILSSAVGTLAVSLLAKKPLVVVPSVSVAVFITLCLVIKSGYSVSFALLCCFAESLIFLFFSFSNWRDKVLSSIPRNLRYGFSAGIGLWLIFTGLRISGLISYSEVGLIVVSNFITPTVVIAFIGILAISIFSYWKFKGAYFYAFALTWGLCIVAQLIGWYQVDETHVSMIPQGIFDVPAWIDSAGAIFDFSNIVGGFSSIFSFCLVFLMVVLALFFMDLMESSATLISLNPDEEISSEPNVLKSKQIFVATAFSSVIATVCGAPSNIVGKNSLVGLKVGGKSGLSSIVCAILMLALVFTVPLFSSVPLVTLVPILFYTGVSYIKTLFKGSFENISEFIPALVVFLFVGFSSSPIFGLALGIIAYTIINICCGKIKKISVFMWIATALSIAFLIFI